MAQTRVASSSRRTPFSSRHREAVESGISVSSKFLNICHGSLNIHGRQVAYFTQDTLDYLRCIYDIPELASLTVPPGTYKSARSAKGRPRDERLFDRQYAPYVYGGPHEHVAFPPLHSSWVDHPPRHDNAHFSPRAQSRLLAQQNATQVLAPLAYLQNIAQPRRHPLDEKVLMSFHPGFA